MLNPGRQPIALICAHSDPAIEIGAEEAGGQNVYVRKVGEALAALGWQVDMFTRKTNPDDKSIVQHSPHCRTIRLVAGPEEFIHRNELFQYMPEFVKAFQKFQLKETTIYPLVHTNYWLSGWVGLQLQQWSNIRLVHTYHSLGALKYQSVGNSAIAKKPAKLLAPSRLAVEQQILQQACCVVATSHQEHEYLQLHTSQQSCIKVIPLEGKQASARVRQNVNWSAVADQLSDLYQRLLAKSIMHELLWNEWMSQPLGTSASPAVLLPTTSSKSLGKVS